ncbi:hypothetical protein HPB49_004595 [Dermacentor silvarum]|uniref:Uncharacterized protein n=1 Tax=Dermacentor silvarum TaxID=543639 RepID=A0ACB8DMY5_DERSI|nr:hypothetical protein HPB49_004595 [Dermacentor silvarum]
MTKCGGNDPLALSDDHFTNDVGFYPSVDRADIRDYLVHGTSFVTREQLKSYKSLEAHNYVTSGLVEPPRVKVRDGSVIVVGKVCALIEKQTKAQSASEKWHQFRTGRITASNAGALFATSLTEPSRSLLKRLCYPEDCKFQTAATEWGKKKEAAARAAYVEAMQKHHLGFKCQVSGLHISIERPFLAATPHGPVHCDCCGDGLVEIKCPYSAKDALVHEIPERQRSYLVVDAAMADVLSLTPLNMPNMDVVRVEGEDIQPEELDQGHWFEIKRNHRRLTVDVDRPRSDKTPLQRANETSWNKKKGNRQIRQLIVASRMPHLPVDDYRIIIRPRGGLNVTEHGTDRIYHSVRRAANVERTADEEDNLCLNQKQNIIVLSTTSKERAKKYVAITSLSIGSKEYEACAYRAAPENTSKGVIRGISADEGPEDIVRKLVTPRNPSVLYAKRMGNTNNVIVLFDGYYVPSYVNYGAALVRCALYKKQFDICYECGRLGHRADVCPNPTDKICRSCGSKNPKQDHECKAECQLCGNDHPTADKRCQERYRIPYLVKRRRWERARREEQVEYENYVDNQRSPSTASRNRSGSLPRTRSRSHSGNRSRSRSRPRSGNPTKSPQAIGNSKGTIGNHTTGPPSQVRFEEQELKINKKKEPGATWADKVKGTVKATGNVAIASQIQSNDTRVEQLMREVISLKKANEELKKQIQEMNKGLRAESGNVAVAKPVSRSNSQEEEGTPAPKKRAVVPEVESMCSVLEEIKNAIKDLKDTVDSVNLKVDKIWKWKLTAGKRLKKLEAQGDDEEYMPSEAESVRTLPGAVGSTVKRTVTGGSKSVGNCNNNG